MFSSISGMRGANIYVILFMQELNLVVLIKGFGEDHEVTWMYQDSKIEF